MTDLSILTRSRVRKAKKLATSNCGRELVIQLNRKGIQNICSQVSLRYDSGREDLKAHRWVKC